MNQTLGFDVRMPIFSHESFGNSVELQSKKVLSRLSHTPWAATYLKSGALSGIAIEQCATNHITSLTDLDQLLKAILRCYEQQDRAEAEAEAASLAENEYEEDGEYATTHVSPDQLSAAMDITAAVAGGDEADVLTGGAPTRGNWHLRRQSTHADAEGAPAVPGRRSLPWAVRDAFFGRRVCPAVSASSAIGAGLHCVEPRALEPQHTPASPPQTEEANDVSGAPLQWQHWSPSVAEYGEDDLEDDVMVSPMSSARPSTASPRATATPRTSPAMVAAGVLRGGGGGGEADEQDGIGARSTTSTAVPVSPVEDPGRKTLPYPYPNATNPLTTTAVDNNNTNNNTCVLCSSSSASSDGPAHARDGEANSPSPSDHTAVAARGSVEWDDEEEADLAGLKHGHHRAGNHDESDEGRPKDKVRKTAHLAVQEELPESAYHAHHSHSHAHRHEELSAGPAPLYGSPTQPATSMTPEELAGWLHLAVWTRCEIVSLLRELSGVQGYIAWSAWYWSYALKHPRYAMVHQALGSLNFWKRLLHDGFSSRLANVHLVANQHMFQLKSAFQLLVSCIGALHGLLERMNGRLEEIQKQSELRSSAVAAAAAVTCTRCVTAAPSMYSLEELGISQSAMGSPLLRRSMSRTVSPHTAAASSPGRSVSLDSEEDHPHPALQRSALKTSMGAPARSFALAEPTNSTANTNTSAGLPPVGGASIAAGGGSSVLGAAAQAINANASALDSTIAPDYLMLEELRVAVLSTVASVLSVIRPQSVSSVLAQSNAAFSENTTLEQLADMRDVSSMNSAEDGLEAPRGHRGVDSARPHHAYPTRSGSSYGLDRPVSPLGEDEPFYFASTAVPRRFGEVQVARTLSLREGVAALLYCTESSKLLLRELLQLVVVENRPPATRHWIRVVLAAAVVGPAFCWLYAKSPEQVANGLHTVGSILKTLFNSYVAMPFSQIRDAIFYVRPGVEDRRRTLDRDAEALANIIRDYHENYYPTMPQHKLDAIRDHTFECFRDGVADTEGYGLIEKHYRDAVKHPIRSAFFGDLPRILLIQLSYQQLEVTRVVNGMDEVLEGNDLNFKIMAIMPVLGLVGLGTLWGFLRRRAKFKSMQMRMKQYWRAVSRVVTFAEGGSYPLGVAGAYGSTAGFETVPFSPTIYGEGIYTLTAWDTTRRHHPMAGAGGSNNSIAGWQPVTPSPQERTMRHDILQAAHRMQTEPAAAQGSIDVWAAADASLGGHSGVDAMNVNTMGGAPSPRRPQLQPVSTAASAGRDGGVADDGWRTPAAPTPAATTLFLSNYEQGTVLLLTHLMRSTAIWSLRGYPYYYELMSDLDDLESAQCSRHQRMQTLQRIITTHDFLK